MKLLFIGNSHTYYNDVAGTVLSLLEATGEKSHVTMLTRAGKSLGHHVTDPAVSFNIRYGRYDFIIAQDRGSVFEAEAFEQGAVAIKQMADAVGARFMLFMPWSPRDNRAAQRDMTEGYLSFCRRTDCRFAPVGEAFTRLLATEQPEALYREDGNHATALGGYAAAVTIFYTVTGRKRTLDPTKIDDPGIAAGFSPELCRKVHTEACYTTRLFNG
ncbi:MAG: hypothetical protein E7636_07075 [Ruminococcaceae bacterium]|nr:hypothetical protein [Oscillospiraceae bacterium]